MECAEVPRTLRQLLRLVVEQQLEAFAQRKQDAHLLKVLTEADIADGREVGRIVSGGVESNSRIPDLDQAVDTAIIAFKDGFYFVFINDVQVEDLDTSIGEVNDVLFVRLTPLVGG